MDFKSLIGQQFDEMYLFELLLFDIEEHIQNYYGKFIHIYFERLTDQKFKITEVNDFRSEHDQDLTERKIIEKREWISIGQQGKTVHLLLCRFDRTGTISIVGSKWGTHTQDWKTGWADERPELDVPLTGEERRIGFLELAGVFEDQMKLQKLKTKRAV